MFLWIISFFTFLATFLSPQTALAHKPQCREVFVLSGGGSPTSNHERYYQSIERAHQVYPSNQCKVTNFVATGNKDDKVTLQYGHVRLQQKDSKKILKVKKLMIDEVTGLPLLTAQDPVGGIQGAAKYEDLLRAAQQMPPKKENKFLSFFFNSNKPVVFYVTDHGISNEGSGEVVLWDGKTLTIPQLRNVLNSFPENQNIVLLFDQCYGGSMLSSLWDEKGKVRAGSCGIAAASPQQLAFSTGGIMKKLHQFMVEKDLPDHLKKRKKFTYKDLHQALIEEESVRSSPILSSDLYANQWFERKFPGSFQENYDRKSLLPPHRHCFQDKGQADTLPKIHAELTSQFFQQIKKEWESLHEELKKELKVSAIDDQTLSQLLAHLQELETEADAKFKLFQKFLLQKFNRHVREKAEELHKDFTEYDLLKTRQGNGEALSETESQQLAQWQSEIDLFRATVKDEAKIASKHPQIPSFTHPTEKTISIVREHDRRKKEKNDALNKMFHTKHLLTRLVTLNALHKMMEEGDVQAAQNYLQLSECEKMTAGEI